MLVEPSKVLPDTLLSFLFDFLTLLFVHEKLNYLRYGKWLTDDIFFCLNLFAIPRAKRDRVFFYDPSEGELLLAASSLEKRLARALGSRELAFGDGLT